MRIRPVREVSPWSLGSGVSLRELIQLPHGLVISGKILMALIASLIWMLRHYVITGTLFMLMGAYVQFGTWWLAVPLALLVPGAYWGTRIAVAMAAGEATTVPAVISGLNRARVVRRSWHRVLHELKMHSRGDAGEVPPLLGVVPTMSGFKGKVVTGSIAMDSSKLVKAEPELAAGFFCDRVIVRPVTPSMASVRFDWGQHLRQEYTLGDLPEVQQRRGTPALVRFGVQADGSPASIVSNLSTLVGGITGSGKSSTAWALLAGYLEQVPVRVRVVDPPAMEFPKLAEAVGKGFVHSYGVDPSLVQHLMPGFSSLKDFWADLETAFTQRLRSVSEAGSRMHVPTVEEPLDITLIDELLPIAEELKKKNAPTEHIVGKIAYLGRKAGFVVIALTQAAQVDTIGRIRDLFPQRLSHKTGNRFNTDAILGDGAESDGARASRLDLAHDRGVGYMAGPGGYLGLRSAQVTASDMEQIAQGQRPVPVFGKGPEPHSTYAFFNKNKEWLYIGIAEKDRVNVRWGEHRREKPWWNEVDEVSGKVELDTYPDEPTARTAEALLIKKHKPKYNKQHNMKHYQG